MSDWNLKGNRLLLIYAFRYALGRETSAPDTIMESIRQNLAEITSHDLELYSREIEEHYRHQTDVNQKQWLAFVDELKAELNKRAL